MSPPGDWRSRIKIRIRIGDSDCLPQWDQTRKNVPKGTVADIISTYIQDASCRTFWSSPALCGVGPSFWCPFSYVFFSCLSWRAFPLLCWPRYWHPKVSILGSCLVPFWGSGAHARMVLPLHRELDLEGSGRSGIRFFFLFSFICFFRGDRRVSESFRL